MSVMLIVRNSRAAAAAVVAAAEVVETEAGFSCLCDVCVPNTAASVAVAGLIDEVDLFLFCSPLRGLKGVLRTALDSSGRGLLAGVEEPLACAFDGEADLLILL